MEDNQIKLDLLPKTGFIPSKKICEIMGIELITLKSLIKLEIWPKGIMINNYTYWKSKIVERILKKMIKDKIPYKIFDTKWLTLEIQYVIEEIFKSHSEFTANDIKSHIMNKHQITLKFYNPHNKINLILLKNNKIKRMSRESKNGYSYQLIK